MHVQSLYIALPYNGPPENALLDEAAPVADVG